MPLLLSEPTEKYDDLELVPKNCQQALTAAEYPERVSLRAYHPEHAPNPNDLSRFAKILNAAKRPVLYAGGGVITSGAAADLAKLAEKAALEAQEAQQTSQLPKK